MIKRFVVFIFFLAWSVAAWGSNWNNALDSEGRIKEGSSPTLAEMRQSLKQRFLEDGYNFQRYSKFIIKPSGNPKPLLQRHQDDPKITHAMLNSGLTSYIRFENGVVKVDQKSPKNRFGNLIDDKTKLFSMSVTKSIYSYILGHAICEGYIDNINANMDDWPLVENTLYANRSLSDLINMNAGDSKYIKRYIFH